MKSTRRGFGGVLAAAAGTGPGFGAVPAGNHWRERGMKLGVSHQRPENLTAAHLNYLKQMGVEYLEIRTPAARSSRAELLAIKRRVEGAGLKVFEIRFIFAMSDRRCRTSMKRFRITGIRLCSGWRGRCAR